MPIRTTVASCKIPQNHMCPLFNQPHQGTQISPSPFKNSKCMKIPCSTRVWKQRLKTRPHVVLLTRTMLLCVEKKDIFCWKGGDISSAKQAQSTVVRGGQGHTSASVVSWLQLPTAQIIPCQLSSGGAWTTPHAARPGRWPHIVRMFFVSAEV